MKQNKILYRIYYIYKASVHEDSQKHTYQAYC